MNYYNSYKRILVYLLLGFNFVSCLTWDLPTECTEDAPSLSVTTGETVSVTAGGSTANWSLVNSAGSVVLSSSGTSLSFSPTSVASGSYTIKAVGRNSCGFKFDLSQVYVKANQLVVNNDIANVTAGSSVTIPVLANDVLNSAPLQRGSVAVPSIVLQPTKGTVLVNPDGTLVYQASPNASGTDVFRYQVCLAGEPATCGVGEVSVTITNILSVNNDLASVTVGSSVTIPILANDLLNGAVLQRSSITAPSIVLQPSKGSVSVNADGSLIYRSNPGSSGTDMFRYQICLANEPSNCGIGEVSISILSMPNVIEMVTIPGGTFQMGDIRNEGTSEEKPVRNITVSSFRMSRFEITQTLYRTLMGSNPSLFSGCENCPVENVSWFEAVAFCNALSDLEGRQRVYVIIGTNVAIPDWNANGYRLPTEAEWEFAAGGAVGSSSRTRFGNGRDILDASQANFDARAAEKRPYSNIGFFNNRTLPVGSFSPNNFGLYDMSGNVFEWCNDWYGAYTTDVVVNPRGPSSSDKRILRGGSWGFGPFFSRISSRNYLEPDGRGHNTGFRVVTRN